jgi:hypothetical protein
LDGVGIGWLGHQAKQYAGECGDGLRPTQIAEIKTVSGTVFFLK